MRASPLKCLIAALTFAVPGMVHGATFTVTGTADSGAGSLRQAILDANAAAGADQIEFAIPVAGPHMIAVASALPEITERVTIDGYTQSGAVENTSAAAFNATLMVHVDGTAVAGSPNGLRVAAGSESVIRGLVVTGFGDDGIELAGAGGHRVEGCIVGLLPDATTTASNGGDGVAVFSSGNTVGGADPSHRNLLSGNGGSGVNLVAATSTANVVRGNLIGTDRNGVTDLGNALDGVIVLDASNNTVRDNRVAGNDRFGILVFATTGNTATDNHLRGNSVGLAVNGELLANGSDGINISDASDNLIGGATPAERNVIVDDNGAAVSVTLFNGGQPVDGNRVIGNFIGTNESGTDAPGSALFGVFVLSATGTEISDNVISGNEEGVRVNAFAGVVDGTLIDGNLIGLSASGEEVIGNTSHGIHALEGAALATISANTIAGNEGNGVFLVDGSDHTLIGNRIGVSTSGDHDAVFGNGMQGVFIINADQVQVGGPGPSDGNEIRNSGDAAVLVIGSNNVVERNLLASSTFHGVRVVGDTNDRNRISANSIVGNGNLGIELGDFDGVTGNDAGDGDSGPNEQMNYPILTSVDADAAMLSIGGTLDAAVLPVRAEFFSGRACDGSGFGEGERFLGADDILASNWMTTLSAVVTEGEFITATATDIDGNTSEFSQCLEVIGAEVLFADSLESTADG